MVPGGLRPFLYNSSAYSCYLFLISSASVKTFSISVLYCAHLCMKCYLGIPNFLEEVCSLSHSIGFLYFLALIMEEGFLISPCCSLELCIQIGRSFLFSFGCVRPPQTSISPCCVSFSWGWFWSPLLVQCYKPPQSIVKIVCNCGCFLCVPTFSLSLIHLDIL